MLYFIISLQLADIATTHYALKHDHRSTAPTSFP